jgi:predicted nucleotidyltransferase
MISERHKATIVRCARRYGVSAVILFGSALKEGRRPRDIDLGVKGLDPRRFFDFYAELVKALPMPVDLVDLSKRSLFNELVEETGVRIYG